MTEKQKKGLSAAAPYITIVIALVGFWFTLLNNFQTKVEAAAKEQKTLQTFEMVQKQMALDNEKTQAVIEEIKKNNRISDLNRRIDYLTEYKYKLKAYLRDHEDQETRTELQAIETELKETKEELDNLLIGN